jgi:hypothetical protein
VLIGQEAMFPLGFTIDNWFKHAYHRVDWEIDGHHLGYITLDLHGDHNPNVTSFKDFSILWLLVETWSKI